MNANPNQQVRVNGVQYRLQFRKCGKPGCKCSTGEGHGPYWYSYDGQSAAKYVGSKLPDAVVKHRELLKANGAKLKEIKAKISKRSADLYQAYLQAEKQLQHIRALEAGEYASEQILKGLGLGQFNGHA